MNTTDKKIIAGLGKQIQEIGSRINIELTTLNERVKILEQKIKERKLPINGKLLNHSHGVEIINPKRFDVIIDLTARGIKSQEEAAEIGNKFINEYFKPFVTENKIIKFKLTLNDEGN